jgi:hypothetical protein
MIASLLKSAGESLNQTGPNGGMLLDVTVAGAPPPPDHSLLWVFAGVAVAGMVLSGFCLRDDPSMSAMLALPSALVLFFAITQFTSALNVRIDDGKPKPPEPTTHARQLTRAEIRTVIASRYRVTIPPLYAQQIDSLRGLGTNDVCKGVGVLSGPHCTVRDGRLVVPGVTTSNERIECAVWPLGTAPFEVDLQCGTGGRG